jgi:hypothetical protein
MFPVLSDFLPTTNFLQNTFSERLLSHDFNFYQMFTVDLLHEFELGVWKSIFTHLLRILYAHGDGKIQELNKRFGVMVTASVKSC